MSSDIPVSAEPTKTVSQSVCDECGANLSAALQDAVLSTPMGRQRAMVACPACGAIYAFNLTWTPVVLGIEPESNTELHQLVTTELESSPRWSAEDILRREG